MKFISKRILLVVLAISIALTSLGFLLTQVLAALSPSTVAWPVDVRRQQWIIIQGYYNSPDNSDHGPGGKNANLSQLYGFDLQLESGSDATLSQPVLSPVNGKFQNNMVDADHPNSGKCLFIEINGYSPVKEASLCHVNPDWSKVGKPVTQGEQIGTIARDRIGDNHLHFNLRTKGTNLPVPFSKPFGLKDCKEYPANGTLYKEDEEYKYNGSKNQYRNELIDCQKPYGYWMGPSPSSRNVTVGNDKIDLGFDAFDNNNSGLDRVEFRITEDEGKSWKTYRDTSRKFINGNNRVQYFASFPLHNKSVVFGADVYSKNGAYRQAVDGLRRICIKGQSCPKGVVSYVNNRVYNPIGGGESSNSTEPELCSGANYTGDCIVLPVGTYNDVSQQGVNFPVKSVWMPEGTRTLFTRDQTNQNGTPQTFDSSNADLSANDRNTTVKSAKVERKLNVSCTVAPNVNQIVLFRNVNFDGGCLGVSDTIDDLGQMDFTRFSSIRFSGSFIGHKKMTLYKRVKQEIRSECGVIITTDKSDLRECAQVDIVSIKIEDYTQPQQANNIASGAILDPSNAGNAVDGDLNTYWVGGHKQAINFTFPSLQTIKKVVVFDLPQGNQTNNLGNNQINKVQLDFLDGTYTPEVDMESGGRRCAVLSFADRAIKKVRVVPADASGENGFREVFIYDTLGAVDNPCDNEHSVTIQGTPVVEPEPTSQANNSENENKPAETSPSQQSSEQEQPASESTPQPVVLTTVPVEAEHQHTIDPAYVEKKCPTCSNGQFVLNVGSNGVEGGPTNGEIRWYVEFKREGTYELTVSYCNVQDMQGVVTVNGKASDISYPNSGGLCHDSGSPAQTTISVFIRAGSNTLSFTNPHIKQSGDPRLGIDKMVLVG